MNKTIKRFAFAVSFLALLFAGGCTDDILPEITTLDVSRLFSPTDIDVRVVNQTSVRLSWRAVKNASSYTIEFLKMLMRIFPALLKGPFRMLQWTNCQLWFLDLQVKPPILFVLRQLAME
jgi:hypothetical protein